MVYRRIAGIMLCLSTLCFLLVTIIWPRSSSQSVGITTTGGLQGTIKLTLPQRGWRGDWSALTVDLITSGVQGNEFPLTVRAELEILGITEFQPHGSVSSVISPGESAHFNWRLRSADSGSVNGTIWVFAIEGDGDEQLLFGREFLFDSMDYGFLPPSLARTLAVICFITGIFLIFWRKKTRVDKNS